MRKKTTKRRTEKIVVVPRITDEDFEPLMCGECGKPTKIGFVTTVIQGFSFIEKGVILKASCKSCKLSDEFVLVKKDHWRGVVKPAGKWKDFMELIGTPEGIERTQKRSKVFKEAMEEAAPIVENMFKKQLAPPIKPSKKKKAERKKKVKKKVK